jgi:hypothetical protein
MTVFFEVRDYQAYLDMLAERTRRWGIDVWAYCALLECRGAPRG